jgi:prepilin-type N-terminal cleavage/methylation domain-containing protein
MRTTFHPRRNAFTIIELMIALGLLAVFCTMFVPLLASLTRERRASAQEQAALQHVANVLDDLTRRPYAALTAEAKPAVDIPAHVQQMLPQAEQTVAVTPGSGEPMAAQVTVSLKWQQPGGVWSHPVTLSAWVPAPKGGTP